MAKSQIVMEFSSEDRKILASLNKLEGKFKTLETNVGKGGANMRKSFNKVGDEAEKSGKKAKDAFDPKKLIKPMVTGLVGTGGLLLAIRAVGAEFDKLKRTQESAATAQLTLSQARAQLAINLPGKTPGQVTAFQQQLGQLATKTNVRQSVLTSGAASAVSAAAGDIPLALSAVGAAARILPLHPGQQIDLAGALVDLASLTGSKDIRVSAGVMQFIGGLGRVVKPLQQARNIPAAMKSLRTLGGTVTGAGALFATLTTLAADPLGESSRTASIQLASQLRDFLPGDLTIRQRIKRVQSDPTLRENFLAGASFEARFKAPIEQLVTPGTEAARLFKSNVAAFPKSNAGFIREFDATLARLAADPLAENAQIGRVFGAGAEQVRTTRARAGRASIVRQGLSDVLDATGRGAISGRVGGVLFEIESGMGRRRPVAVAAGAIEDRIAVLEGPTNPMTSRFAGRGPNVEDQEVIGILRKMLVQLEQLVQVGNGGRSLIPAGEDFRRFGPSMLMAE